MTRSAYAATMLFVVTFSASAQPRPDFSGVWKLDPAASRMVGPGGRVSSGPQTRELRWIVDHRDPRITVTVDLRDSSMRREWSFTCTTDGHECVNELRDLNEVRRTVARWVGDTLQMTTQAQTPHGDFQGTDRLWTMDAGRTLIFDRIVRDDRGERVIKQVYRKQERSPAASQAWPGEVQPPGRLVDLGGYRLHLWCRGIPRPGPPTIVLSIGGGFAVDWSLVQGPLCRNCRFAEGWSVIL